MAPHADNDHYQPVDSLRAGMTGAMVTGAAGLFAASIQNATRTTNVGALGVFTKSGGLICTWAAVGGTYEFVRNASANLRETKDHYNSGIAGFLAGSILGMRSGRTPQVLGYGAVTALVLCGFDLAGGSLQGAKPEIMGMDEFERKEYMRKNRRRPVEETIANIGEGRGVYAPGYQERRRERLKEKYGVDIQPVSAEAT